MPTPRTALFPGLMAAALTLAAASAAVGQDQPPVVKSGVELVLVDVQVVDRKGAPLVGLKPEQFQVTLDGKRRKVASAELIESNTGLPAGGAPAADAPVPSAIRAKVRPGNIYVLAVDQGSFRPVNAPSVVHAAREFLKRVQPNDYVGMISFPSPGVVINPTRERAELEGAIPRLVGYSAVKQMRQHNYSLSDAIDVASRDRGALKRVVERNCAPGDLGCSNSVEMEMNETVSGLELQAARSFHGIREVISAVKGIEGRKTVVILSAGVPTGDSSGGRLYMRNDAVQAGKEAADAGILLYTLHLNSAFLDAFSPDAPSAAQTAMREAGVYAKGLDIFNGTAGGTFMEVNTGADFAIERMMRETSAYYLLGVEVEEADRDGRMHRIQVKVDQRGTQVRNRASVIVPKKVQ